MQNMPSLPFEIETDAINKWLDTISRIKPVQAGNELNKVLKFVNKQKFEEDKLLLIIDALTPRVLQISNRLEPLFITQTSVLDAKARKIARLSINLLRYTAIAYAQTKHCLNTDQLAVRIFRALQLIGLSLRQSALIYERPSTILWKTTGTLYQLANDKDLLNIIIKEDYQHFKTNVSLLSLIKRNLLFAIANPYEFNPFEIEQLFSIMDQHGEKLIIKVSYNVNAGKTGFYWKYLSAQPPQYFIPAINTLTILQLNTTEVVNFFQSSKFHYPFTKFNHVVQRLSGYKKILFSVVVSEPIIVKLATGFEQTAELLKKQIQEGKLLQLSADDPNQTISSLENMNLEPFGHQKISGKAESVEYTHFLSSGPVMQTAKIQLTKDKNFCVAETTTLNCAVGELILLIAAKKTTLGTIRQIHSIAETNSHRILVEQWDGRISCSEIQHTVVAANTVILITNFDPDTPTLALFAPDKFSTGASIKLQQGEFILNKLIESTDHYMLYQIIPH